MARQPSDMSPEERQEHRSLKQLIDSPMTSEQERKRYRERLQALEFEGNIAPVMERVVRLEQSVLKLTKQLNDILSDVKDEITTAIMAEAQAAAQQAVTDLLGEPKKGRK